MRYGRISRKRIMGYLITPLLALLTAATVCPPLAQAAATDCKSSSYDCTPGYTGSNAANTWAWTFYGGQTAQTSNGYHNCTLYAAWRLAQNGMPDPKRSWGFATEWADSIGGGNHTPTVGSIAWWARGKGHVAYVEQVNGTQVFIRADNYVYQGPGYTSSGWISASTVDLFLHPHDGGGGGGNGTPPGQPGPASGPQAPLIVSTSTYQEGVLVYARTNYTDVNGDAEGFGFRWRPGTESHPFSSPSYGRVSPGRVDYPFNLACGQPNQYAVDVQMWIYDKGGLKSRPVTVHVACRRGT